MLTVVGQACSDVLTKKKLDTHRNQCHGASFTCLDCMVHFRGTEYRWHTVRYTLHCVTENYFGARLCLFASVFQSAPNRLISLPATG